MMTESYILAIGKLKDMPEDVLWYEKEFYNETSPDAQVIGRFAQQYTTHDSHILALCILDTDKLFSFDKHFVTSVPDDIPHEDFEHFRPVLEKAKECLKKGIQLFFIPNV